MNDQPLGANHDIVSLVKPYRPSTEVQVRAYGQLYSVDTCGNMSLDSMRASVQMQMGMKEQTILLHDSEGNMLNSDVQLQEACEQGRLPFQALLADTAINEMEMKRDEIAQMQWRMVREQFTSINKATNSMASQLTEVKSTVNQQKIELTFIEERLRNELRGILAKETADRHDDLQNTCNRIDELARAIHSESSTREVVAMQLQKQVESNKILLEGIKQKQDFDINQFRMDLDNVKLGLQSELKSSEQIMSNKINDLKILEATCEELGKLVRQETRDRQSLHQSILEKLAASSENLEIQLQNVQTAQQVFKNDISERVRKLDEVNLQFQTRIHEKWEKWDQETVDINKRCDTLKLDFENTKVQQKTNLEALNKAFDTIKIQNLTDRIKNCEEHFKTTMAQEHETRNTQNRALWNALTIYTTEPKSERTPLKSGASGATTPFKPIPISALTMTNSVAATTPVSKASQGEGTPASVPTNPSMRSSAISSNLRSITVPTATCGHSGPGTPRMPGPYPDLARTPREAFEKFAGPEVRPRTPMRNTIGVPSDARHHLGGSLEVLPRQLDMQTMMQPRASRSPSPSRDRLASYPMIVMGNSVPQNGNNFNLMGSRTNSTPKFTLR